MFESGFLEGFKQATEVRWRVKSFDPMIYGLQFQQGTRWNAGLSNEQIAEYESALKVRFPHDFKAFLREMNGTDLPTLNVQGFCDFESVGAYSYPRDIELVKRRVEIASDLTGTGFKLLPEAMLVPIFQDRYVVCSSNLDDSVVLCVVLRYTSIVVRANNAFVYANSLQEYLQKEFLETAL